jgi:hypothetical protein
MNADPLITTLIDLLRAIGGGGGPGDFKLILGGGFGLYLKQLHLQERSTARAVRTLLPGELWPLPRATEDLDVFLPTEFVISLADMTRLREALDRIGFRPVEEAKFLHFVKAWGAAGRVKIDLLTGPLDDAARAKVKVTPPRVRPRGPLELHAYLTEEALGLEESLLALTVSGVGSDAQASSVVVHIPQPFTFLMMKLHAFADRSADPDADLGRHHALDVYRIVAMLTEDEFEQVRQRVKHHGASHPVVQARQIVQTHFSSPTALGLIRLREHSLFAQRMDTGGLVGALAELFS